jgi:hypothetical protein
MFSGWTVPQTAKDEMLHSSIPQGSILISAWAAMPGITLS